MKNNKKDTEKTLPVLENTEELNIVGFDEVETPDADIVSLGSASYTKMLGKTNT